MPYRPCYYFSLAGKVMLASLRCKYCNEYPIKHSGEDMLCPDERRIPVTVKRPCGCVGNTGKPLFPGQFHEVECVLRVPNERVS